MLFPPTLNFSSTSTSSTVMYSYTWKYLPDSPTLFLCRASSEVLIHTYTEKVSLKLLVFSSRGSHTHGQILLIARVSHSSALILLLCFVFIGVSAKKP